MAVTGAGAIADECVRMRRLRHIVDIAARFVEQGGLTRSEAEALVASTRLRVLELFPDGEQAYEIIYARRFSRLIAQFTPDPPDPPGRQAVVLPFPAAAAPRR